MYLLISCILLNASLTIIFKYFDRYKVDLFQSIAINYVTCFITGSLVIGHFHFVPKSVGSEWFPYALILGVLFITVFNFVGATVKTNGVMAASIFQKMSLVAPTLLGLMVYQESSGWYKILGIFLAIGSIFVLVRPSGSEHDSTAATPTRKSMALLLYPMATFLGSCLIDGGLYLVQRQNWIHGEDLPFTTILFGVAALGGIMGMVYQYLREGKTLKKSSIIGGIILGVPNFFSIYLLMLVLASGWEGSFVFPVNNVGILSVSALVGVLVFKELLSVSKFAGLAMAVLSILLISNN